MPIQNSGSISLLDIANEFGGAAPHSLSEYYGAAGGIPASGAIQLDDFYGASAAFTFTLTSNTQQGNIRTLAVAGGWDGSSSLVFVIDTNVVVWSDNVSIAALTTGTNFPNGLTIVNKGKIMGRGGDGPTTETGTGQAGGPAIELNVPVTINNSQGYIGGGGGGGSGPFAGAGAGGGLTPYVHPSFTSADTGESNTVTRVPAASIAQVPLNSNGVQDGRYGTNSYNLQTITMRPVGSSGGGNGGFLRSTDIFI
jgi:hypothetical protein